jgi:hypothetical protein
VADMRITTQRAAHVVVAAPRCHNTGLMTASRSPFSCLAVHQLDNKNYINENSLVIMLQYARAFRALFMGDAGFQSEVGLLTQKVNMHSAFSHSPAALSSAQQVRGSALFRSGDIASSDTPLRRRSQR